MTNQKEIHSKTESKFRNLEVAQILFALGSILLAFSCAPSVMNGRQAIFLLLEKPRDLILSKIMPSNLGV